MSARRLYSSVRYFLGMTTLPSPLPSDASPRVASETEIQRLVGFIDGITSTLGEASVSTYPAGVIEKGTVNFLNQLHAPVSCVFAQELRLAIDHILALIADNQKGKDAVLADFANYIAGFNKVEFLQPIIESAPGIQPSSADESMVQQRDMLLVALGQQLKEAKHSYDDTDPDAYDSRIEGRRQMALIHERIQQVKLGVFADALAHLPIGPEMRDAFDLDPDSTILPGFKHQALCRSFEAKSLEYFKQAKAEAQELAKTVAEEDIILVDPNSTEDQIADIHIARDIRDHNGTSLRAPKLSIGVVKGAEQFSLHIRPNAENSYGLVAQESYYGAQWDEDVGYSDGPVHQTLPWELGDFTTIDAALSEANKVSPLLSKIANVFLNDASYHALVLGVSRSIDGPGDWSDMRKDLDLIVNALSPLISLRRHAWPIAAKWDTSEEANVSHALLELERWVDIESVPNELADRDETPAQRLAAKMEIVSRVGELLYHCEYREAVELIHSVSGPNVVSKQLNHSHQIQMIEQSLVRPNLERSVDHDPA